MEAIDEAESHAAGRLLFPGAMGGHLNLGNWRKRVWYPALDKAGLKRRPPYQLRHTFATLSLATGRIQRVIGAGSSLVQPARTAYPSDGAKRIRTADLLGAIQALSQLSYSPAKAQYIERQAESDPGSTGAPASPSCVLSTRMSGSPGSSRRTRDSTNAAGIHSSALLVR
jgi:hypothetical protein